MAEPSDVASGGPRAGRPSMPKSYGLAPESEGEILPWSWAEERLTQSRNYWVVTVRPDGRPHAMPVWGAWVEGAFYFGTGSDSRKGRNIAADPRAVVHLESGDEVVVLEGIMEEVTDTEGIRTFEQGFNPKYGFEGDSEEIDLVEMGAVIFRMSPLVAFGWTEANFPQNATRWVFGEGQTV